MSAIGGKADMCGAVQMSANDPKQTQYRLAYAKSRPKRFTCRNY
jgi:hypothetical protein